MRSRISKNLTVKLDSRAAAVLVWDSGCFLFDKKPADGQRKMVHLHFQQFCVNFRQSIKKNKFPLTFFKNFSKPETIFQVIHLSLNIGNDEGGKNVSANERRQILLAELISNRHDTCENLAQKFNVTTRTIYHDIEMLTCAYPVEAIRGRYGGVKLADWFCPNATSLSPEQFALLSS